MKGIAAVGLDGIESTAPTTDVASTGGSNVLKGTRPHRLRMTKYRPHDGRCINGGGGGASGSNGNDSGAGAGGDGGGFIFIASPTLTVTGSMSADASPGASAPVPSSASAGAGGAGGSIKLVVSSATLGTNLVTGRGANGGEDMTEMVPELRPAATDRRMAEEAPAALVASAWSIAAVRAE